MPKAALLALKTTCFEMAPRALGGAFGGVRADSSRRTCRKLAVTWHFWRLALSNTLSTIALGDQTRGLVAARPKSRRFLRNGLNKQKGQKTPKIGVTSMPHHSTLLGAITAHHKITGLLYEGVPSTTQYESFAKLLHALEEPRRGLASSWCIADVWRLGSPTRRKRVVVIAAAHDRLRTGELELPMPGDERLPTDKLTMPTAVDYLDPASSIPEEYRVATGEYEEPSEDHFQYACPSIQVGRLRNERKKHYVYDPKRGPVTTIRATMFKAEGPRRNTGLIMDEIGPRRITPVECARIHGFATAVLLHLTPHQLYSIIGNSVTSFIIIIIIVIIIII